MKEENKYYTPEISEFHVGFEYEVYDRLHKSWNKENDFWNQQGDFSDDIRVKYLDKEDIESFGFIPSQKEDTFYILKKKDIMYFFILLPIENKYEIRVSNPSIHFGGFLGYIKNKSELRKILTQLEIL